MGGPRCPPGRGGHGGAPAPLLLPLLLLLAGLPSHTVLSARQEGSCRFPSRWEGQWFQSGVRQGITIQHNRLSNKGRCVASDGEKYLVVDDKGSCYRCVVIHEKHVNVLQYKETFCQGHTGLDQLCKLITGDALLFSMFRLGGSPVACPFRGPLAFTYNRGHGDCRSPMSSVEACTQESRLLLRYQACPDVYGTESTAEELQCLATWKEGSARYLVGKVHHSHATSNEDRFRCFVYEQVNAHGNGLGFGNGLGMQGLGLDDEGAGLGHGLQGLQGLGRGHDAGVVFRVAQSGDATCNGLSSDMEGSRTMTLYKTEAAAPSRCKFPSWLSAHPHWHTLDYRRSYSLHQKNTSLKISNTTADSDMDDMDLNLGARDGPSRGGAAPSVDMLDPVVAAATGLDPQDGSQHDEMRVTCTEARAEGDHAAHIVAHFTMGCQSGFLCMQFYRRDSHVVEVQTGAQTRRQEDACLPANFDRASLPFVTLVTSSPEPKQCPYLGKFSVSGVVREERHPRAAGQAGQGRGGRDRDRWYRRALQEYNPEDDDGGVGEDDDDDEESHYGVRRRRPAGIDDPQEEARLFNKKKKQQEERDARIRADLAARQEQQKKQEEEEATKRQQAKATGPGGHRRGQGQSGPVIGHGYHQLKSHSKRSSRSSGHKAVIEVAAAVGSSEDEDDEDEDEEEDEEEDEDLEEEDADMDGAIPNPSDLHLDKSPTTLHRPVVGGAAGGAASVNGAVAAVARVDPTRKQGEGRYRPHALEYGNIDDLLEPSKSSTHWGTYPSDERLLELDSKSSSGSAAKTSSRGRRVRGLGRHAGHAGHASHGPRSSGRRVRRGFGYEGGLSGLGGDPCDRDPGLGPGQSPGSGRMHLYMGCSTQDTMEFRRDCGAPEPDVVSAYTCHGRWEENGTHFLIASPLPRSSRGARRYCFVYREAPGPWPGQSPQGRGVLHFASSSESCQRNLGLGLGWGSQHIASPIAFNVTSSGECMDTSAGAPTVPAKYYLMSAVTAFVIFVGLGTQR